jgi:hypothetical protein
METCDDETACIARWKPVGKTTVSSPYNPEYVTAARSNIMFANANNTSSDHYVKLFNADTAAFTDASVSNDEFCYCGYMGTLVSYDNTFFFMSNGAVRYKPGEASWTTIAGYTGDAYIGEAATAVLGSRMYRIGGRGELKPTFRTYKRVF